MVYNVANAETARRIRQATGNLLPADYPDADLLANAAESFDMIQGNLQRDLTSPLGPTDLGFGTAQRIERMDAAKIALKAYGEEFLGKIQELDREITQMLVALTTAVFTGDEVTEDDEFQKTGHKNWNENTDTPIPNRLKGSSSQSSIEGVPRLDPDLNL